MGGQFENLGCKLPRFHSSFLYNALHLSSFSFIVMQTPLKLALYIILDVVAPLFSTFNLSTQFLFIGTLFISLYCQRIRIVQCFVILGFLSLLENFGLATPIPVGIKVLDVKHPYELNCSREIGHKTKLIPFSTSSSFSLVLQFIFFSFILVIQKEYIPQPCSFMHSKHSYSKN